MNNLLQDCIERKKRSTISLLSGSQALTTGQCLKLSQNISKFVSYEYIISYAIAKFNLQYQNLPAEFKDDVNCLKECVLENNNFLNQIQNSNKQVYKQIVALIGPTKLREIKKAIKDAKWAELKAKIVKNNTAKK